MNRFGTGGAMLLCLAAVCEAQIQVDLLNDASIGDSALAVAQKEASRILKRAGVTLSWCQRVIPGEPCTDPGPATLQVRLYPRGGESNHHVPITSLGVALTSRAPDFGFFAGVFTERITEGRNPRYSYSLMLGHVIAHELGHLLLERTAHSRSGLMTGSWDSLERGLMVMGRLLFDRTEVGEIQANVKVRLASVERASNGN